MMIRDAAARRETGERKRHVGRFGAIHSEKLAHDAGAGGLWPGCYNTSDKHITEVGPKKSRNRS
jgi:hypothetical protein